VKFRKITNSLTLGDSLYKGNISSEKKSLIDCSYKQTADLRNANGAGRLEFSSGTSLIFINIYPEGLALFVCFLFFKAKDSTGRDIKRTGTNSV
jgi:hypothetical protein